MSSRSALVTGGAGFIGGRLCALLLERGDEVVVLDDLSTGRRDRVPEGARLVVGDIRDPDALAHALARVEVVFHLAERVSIRGSPGRARSKLRHASVTIAAAWPSASSRDASSRSEGTSDVALIGPGV